MDSGTQKQALDIGLHSMTGYGSAQCSLGKDEGHYECAVRSLNAKQLDVQIRVPVGWEHREGAIRKQVETHLKRGRIQVFVYAIPHTPAPKALHIDEALFLESYARLSGLVQQVSRPTPEILIPLVLRLPGVLRSTQNAEQNDALCTNGHDTKVWQWVSQCIQKALQACVSMRAKEGAVLGTQIEGYLDNISIYLDQVAKQEKNRNARVQKKLTAQWEEAFRSSESEERFHQELFFYLERMSFEEEKVRLGKHIAFFKETLATAPGQGRKLGFIAQEINREINTLGSKANDARIQSLVVEMKNELEKIKEQLLNVL